MFEAYFPKFTYKGGTYEKHGDGLVMICNEEVMFVDMFQGGEPTDAMINWLRGKVPSKNGVIEIDKGLLTHGHPDHFNGFLHAINSGKVRFKQFLCYDPDTLSHGVGSSSNGRAVKQDIANMRDVISRMEANGAEIRYLKKGDTISLGDITFKVFRDQPTHFTSLDYGEAYAFLNDGSLTIHSHETQLLLGGDGPGDLKTAIEYFDDEVSGYDVSHHGNSCPEHDAKALKRAKCVLAWQSCIEKDGPGTTGWTEFGSRRVRQQDIPVWQQDQPMYIEAYCGRIRFRQGGSTVTKAVPYKGTATEGWQKNATGWWYRYKNGSWPAGKTVALPWSKGIGTFRFDNRGYMVTGWQKIDGKWYFFDEKNGDMKTGWILWDGSWFYLDPGTGVMLHTCWLDYKGKKCYLEGSGRALRSCIKVIDGQAYQFDKDCYATEVKTNFKSDTDQGLNGVDVASYQSSLNPAAMTTTQFIIVKFTQGTWYVNPYADKQYDAAKIAGKLRGAYHYGEGGDAKKEAQYFFKRLGSRIGDCIPGLDWEGMQNPTFGSGKDVEWCLTFCDEFYRLSGVRPIIYMSKSVCWKYDWSKVAAKYQLWCAQYGSNAATDYRKDPWTDSKGFGAWEADTIRQYSSHGSIKGYSGYIDINLAYLSKIDWLELAKPDKKKTIKDAASPSETKWAAEVDQVTNPVKISNSGSDENGNYKGGEAGDQTGKEWRIRDWYSYPWSCVLRHPNAEVRKCLATLAVKAANNDNIGYDQSQRDTYRKALEEAGWDPEKITKAVESDCSAGVIADIIATGHILGIAGLQRFGATYTGNMRKEAGNRGFMVLTDKKYLTSSEYLMAGDIPLNDQHHVCTVVTNGVKSGAEAPLTDRAAYELMPLIKKGSKGKAVKVLQAMLGGLTLDGDFGALTLNSVLALQKQRGLLQDGEVGPLTWHALLGDLPQLKQGSKGKTVKALQIMLGGLTIDGDFGQLTLNSVLAFQKQHGLAQSGEVCQLTWKALIESEL